MNMCLFQMYAFFMDAKGATYLKAAKLFNQFLFGLMDNLTGKRPAEQSFMLHKCLKSYGPNIKIATPHEY